MITRLRRTAATALLSGTLAATGSLLALGGGTASAAGTQVCDTGTQTPSSFCVEYDFAITKAATNTATTQSLDAIDARLHFANTSDASYVTEPEQPRWINHVSATLLSGGGINPVVTGSASLPDGLLLAGQPEGSECAPGTGSTFAACTAGRGEAWVKVDPGNFLLPTGIYKARFGIKRIENETANLGTHFVQLKATIGVCLEKDANTCYLGEQTQSQAFTIDAPEPGQPMTIDMAMPGPQTIFGVTLERFTIHTIDLLLRGTSNRLADGTTLASSRTVVRLPASCGTVSASGTLTAVGGAQVTAEQPFTVTGCTTLTAKATAASVLYGSGATIRGTLLVAGTTTPVVGRTLSISPCPSGSTCTAKTTSTGAYSFTVKPTRNTTYTVTDPTSHRARSTAVQVRPRVSLTTSRTSMPSGGTVRLTGAVAPNHAGKVVRVQRLVSGTWTTITQATLGSASGYAKSVVLKGARGSTARLRVVLPAHADHAQGTSRTVSITFS